MARRTAKFWVQVRFEGETRWRSHDWWLSLKSAMGHCDRLLAVDRALFPNIRLVYKGIVLQRWNRHGAV